MDRLDYVIEAAEALNAPGEIWLFSHKILFDPASKLGYGVLPAPVSRGSGFDGRNQALDLEFAAGCSSSIRMGRSFPPDDQPLTFAEEGEVHEYCP